MVQSFSGLFAVWNTCEVWLTGAPEELKEPKLFVTRLPEGQRLENVHGVWNLS